MTFNLIPARRYYGRHAPGYMDCTPWAALQSERAAHAYLDESDEDDTEDREPQA